MPLSKKEIYLLPVKELGFSASAHSCLKLAGINYLGQLTQLSQSEAHYIPNLEKRHLAEVNNLFRMHGLSYNTELDNRFDKETKKILDVAETREKILTYYKDSQTSRNRISNTEPITEKFIRAQFSNNTPTSTLTQYFNDPKIQNKIKEALEAINERTMSLEKL